MTVDEPSTDAAAAVLAQGGANVERSRSPLGAVLSGRYQQGAQALPRLLRELDRLGVQVLAADVAVPTLDDVFLGLTGRSLREEAEVAA